MSVTKITLSVPTPHLTQMVSNMLGLAGLLALVLFVGGVTGNWWWSLGAAGAIAVGLAWVANTHAQRQTEQPATAGDETQQLRAVPAPARAAPRGAA